MPGWTRSRNESAPLNTTATMGRRGAGHPAVLT